MSASIRETILKHLRGIVRPLGVGRYRRAARLLDSGLAELDRYVDLPSWIDSFGRPPNPATRRAVGALIDLLRDVLARLGRRSRAVATQLRKQLLQLKVGLK